MAMHARATGVRCRTIVSPREKTRQLSNQGLRPGRRQTRLAVCNGTRKAPVIDRYSPSIAHLPRLRLTTLFTKRVNHAGHRRGAVGPASRTNALKHCENGDVPR